MRKLQLLEPNFKCTVSGPSGDIYDQWLLFASSEKEVRNHLAKELFVVHVIEKYDFDEWKSRANKEKLEAIKAKNDPKYKYKQNIWSEIKQFLFSLSNRKCGYCEANVRIVSSGHVEHFRPKRKVEEDPSHPGYYWLAYDIDNYIPCCENCNSARGKRNHFPLIDGSPRAIDESGIVHERVLLLNPFSVDPHSHLSFLGPTAGEKFGHLEGLTSEGNESIKIYNLNRGDLVIARRKAYTFLRQRLELAQFSLANERESLKKEILDEVKTGDCEFSIMVRPVIVNWLEERSLNEKRKMAESQQIYDSLVNDLKMIKKL